MENKQEDTVGLQLTKPNTLYTLYQKPTNHARRKPMEQTKQEQFITNCAIYGYKKDPENKYHWLIDEEAAAVVRRICDNCTCFVAKFLCNAAGVSLVLEAHHEMDVRLC
ncbi:MAG: hypothetical protein EP147_14170 [Subdoligranulum sp.]|nr:hypothetical protein [Subdoligranulum sp.]